MFALKNIAANDHVCSWPWREPQTNNQSCSSLKILQVFRNGDSEAAFKNTNFCRRQLKVLIILA